MLLLVMPRRMNLVVFLIGLTCIIQTGLTQQFVPGQQCNTPENGIGQCFTLSYCPSINIANALNNYPRNDAVQYLQTAERNCGNNNFGGDPVVCCGFDQEYFTTPTTSTPGNPFLPANSPRIGASPIFVNPPPTTRSSPVRSSKVGSECTGTDFIPGTCTPLAQCPTLLARLQANLNDGTFVNFLKSSNKICDNEYSVVCCPIPNAVKVILKLPRNTNEIPRKLPSMADGCGYVDKIVFAARRIRSTNTKLIDYKNLAIRIPVVGGTDSRLGDWPWIALIGYDDGASASPSSFKCGGALITSRHVLTAAHCIRSDLSFVRLGEHNLRTENETNHVDVPVVKYVRHPQYNKLDGHNDIALLYLGQNVQFSEKITPICIPFEPRLRSKNITGSKPHVAGWGRTREGGTPANVLQELQINVFDNEVCKDKYKKQGKLVSEEQFDNAVICAGDLGGGRDTCQGDSGGPLMLPEDFENSKRFHLIGIISYGIGCARRDIPGVYSRVTNFIEWIENGVADTP